jgi:lipopolysaccharide/colanic/teichoic acid biosynthesis glycosyltransferase
MYKHFFKRFIDFWISLIALILISPLIIIVSIWLHFANKGAGVLFFQERAGLKAKPFKVIKFKSMSDKKDETGRLLPDKMRITKVGSFIRKTSIDELPQLFNVLKGDMSLIGPRPLLPEYVPLYNERQAKRLEVRPGITGLAQIHGRNSLKLSKRFEYDAQYVENISFLLDINILWKTIMALFKQKVVVDRKDLVGVDDLGFDKKAFNE